MTDEGELRVWWERAFTWGKEMKYVIVASPIEAIGVLNGFAAARRVGEDVQWNMVGLEVFEDGEWREWYNDEGEDIRDYEERLRAD